MRVGVTPPLKGKGRGFPHGTLGTQHGESFPYCRAPWGFPGWEPIQTVQERLERSPRVGSDREADHAHQRRRGATRCEGDRCRGVGRGQENLSRTPCCPEVGVKGHRPDLTGANERMPGGQCVTGSGIDGVGQGRAASQGHTVNSSIPQLSCVRAHLKPASGLLQQPSLVLCADTDRGLGRPLGNPLPLPISNQSHSPDFLSKSHTRSWPEPDTVWIAGGQAAPVMDWEADQTQDHRNAGVDRTSIGHLIQSPAPRQD